MPTRRFVKSITLSWQLYRCANVPTENLQYKMWTSINIHCVYVERLVFWREWSIFYTCSNYSTYQSKHTNERQLTRLVTKSEHERNFIFFENLLKFLCQFLNKFWVLNTMIHWDRKCSCCVILCYPFIILSAYIICVKHYRVVTKTDTKPSYFGWWDVWYSGDTKLLSDHKIPPMEIYEWKQSATTN